MCSRALVYHTICNQESVSCSSGCSIVVPSCEQEGYVTCCVLYVTFAFSTLSVVDADRCVCFVSAGYKMCARLYLNGDGMGKGTHVSLFFVVMRGAYDALLKWPFRQKVCDLNNQHQQQQQQHSFNSFFRTSGYWQWHQLDHMQVICILLQTDYHASTLSLSF